MTTCVAASETPHPVWTAFLERVAPDPELRAFLQRFCGYCGTGVTTVFSNRTSAPASVSPPQPVTTPVCSPGTVRASARYRTATWTGAPRNLGRLYRQGIVVNTLNPKTALFFLAFLPQFVDPTRGAVWAQILALGLLFAALGFMSDGTWALVAGTLGERLRRSRRFPSVQRYVSGSVFVGLGAVAALTAPVKQT